MGSGATSPTAVPRFPMLAERRDRRVSCSAVQIDRRLRMPRIRMAIAMGTIGVVALGTGGASASTRIVDKKKPHPTSLAKAAAWVAIGPALNLKPDQPAPEQFT